ncbi:MAG: hypothetical protein C4321_09715, partial [Chloroflexota bacterium]
MELSPGGEGAAPAGHVLAERDILRGALREEGWPETVRQLLRSEYFTVPGYRALAELALGRAGDLSSVAGELRAAGDKDLTAVLAELATVD